MIQLCVKTFDKHILPGCCQVYLWRISVRPSDIAGTSQIKYPTMSRWNVAKTSQLYIFSASCWNLMTTSQEDEPTTFHQYVYKTSQKSLK